MGELKVHSKKSFYRKYNWHPKDFKLYFQIELYLSQLSQNRPNPNFDEHEQTSHIHFFDILEVPKSIFKKYSIGGPFR